MDAEKAAKLRKIIERARRDLINRYDLTHSAMRGEFMSAIYSPRVPSSRAQSDINRNLLRIGAEASKTERSIATSVTEDIHKVIDWLETPEMIVDLLIFQNDIVRQIGRDARAISALFRNVQTIISAATKDEHFSIKARALQHITKPGVFRYKDKAGKIWDAKIYLKTRGSKYYYELVNKLATGDIHSEGRKIATLDRPGHPSDKLRIDLADIDQKMRSKYFHPGSQGILT